MRPPTRHQWNSHPSAVVMTAYRPGIPGSREAARTFTLSLAPGMSRRWPSREGANASVGSFPLLSAWPKRQEHWTPGPVSAEFQCSS